MLNYVAAYLLTYLIFNSESYWRETEGFNATVFPTGKALPDNALWPAATIHLQGGIALPLGAGLAVLVAVVLWVLYSRTRFGFEVQVLGDSPRAAHYAGMRTRRKILAVMAISGALAGLGGASQDGDFRHTLDADPNGLQRQYYGYAGIVVAALARYNPFAVARRRVPDRRAAERGQHAAGRRLPVRARRRDPGADPLLGARRRAARPLPRALRPARAGRAGGGAAREQLAARRRDRVGHRVRDAAALRRARRAARGALGRAQPRRRGDDARSAP